MSAHDYPEECPVFEVLTAPFNDGKRSFDWHLLERGSHGVAIGIDCILGESVVWLEGMEARVGVLDDQRLYPSALRPMTRAAREVLKACKP